jgi:translation initiation factor IF-2
MNKSRRINELARDLEVKSHAILDKLKELGISGKTHSSSVDEDVAAKLKEIFVGGESGHGAESNGAEYEPPADSDERGLYDPEPPAAKPAPEPTPVVEAKPVEKPPVAHAAPVVHPPKVEENKPAEPAPAAPGTPHAPVAVAAPEEERPAAARPGLRPPLSSGPFRPPLATTPVQRPAGVAPGRPVPPAPRPIPTAPKPGQILTGPRQPLPSTPARSVATPSSPLIQRPAPRPGTVIPPSGQGPGAPSPAIARPAPGGPVARTAPGSPIVQRPNVPRPPSGAPATQQGPGQARPAAGGRPGLVGQPSQRPIVPPRPDLAAKLTAPRVPNPAFAAPPPSPRPGAPMRPPASPTPGRPIYQGPGRPGAPMTTRGPARPGGPGAQRPGGPLRPGMHPTSRTPGGLVGPGAAPPLPDQQRRPGGYNNRPGGRPQGRRRDGDDAEKILRPTRREAPAGPPPVNRDITISEGITVKELSEKLDVKANLVIKKLVDRGIFATINQTLDGKLATDIAREFGASTSTISFEQEAMADVQIMEEATDLQPRAPVVTIMGHVDHGKTSLLDAIREANVASREAGGITQHIGAYHIEKNGRKIVFIDTPGHEAFTRMRARGAKVTDIVVLVVAADDGVMPQTLEAIDHARAAKVPIIVAINKIDRAEAQVDRIKQQLSDRGLLAEDWGGDVVMVPVSARTRQNLDTLLEMILLVADILDLKANPSRPAMGSVLESKLDRGRGPVATVLVRNGTLRVGDFFICGDVFGKVRALIDDRGNQVKECEPSMPVEVLGLDALPAAGDEFQVVTDTAKAKQIVIYREAKARDVALAKNKRLTLEQLQKQMAQGEVKDLNLILKSDVGGSAEVLRDTLEKLSTDKVRVRVLLSGVGAISESDVDLAAASEAIIIGFNVKPDRAAAAAAEHEQVDIRLHSIIYNLTDEIKKAMVGLLAPTYKEIYRGRAEVRQTFKVSKVGTVAGCLVTDGNINRDCMVKIIRDGVVVNKAKVGNLKRFKDDVSEVRNGMECGITLDNFGDVKAGDVLEAYVTEKVISEVA